MGASSKATPGMLNEIIWSVSQMLATFDRTGGKAGAFVTERNAQLKMAGGRAVDCTVRDGLIGVEGELISEQDPRWLSLQHVWLSDEGDYRPPPTMDLKAPLLQRKKIMVFHTIDNADPDALNNKVNEDLKDPEALHGLSPFTYQEAMDLSSEAEIRIFEARWGGLSFKTIGKGLSGMKTAMDVLSVKGWNKLEELAKTKFRHNGSNFKRHKQRIRQPKGGKLTTYKRKPGDSLCTDSYPTGIASTPTFQVVNDPEMPVGWVYPNKLKSDLKFHLQDHFAVFGMPFVVTGGLLQGNAPGGEPNDHKGTGDTAKKLYSVPSMAARRREVHFQGGKYHDLLEARFPVAGKPYHLPGTTRSAFFDSVSNRARWAFDDGIQSVLPDRVQLLNFEKSGLPCVLST